MLITPPATPWENLYQAQGDEAFERAESMSADQLRALRPPLPQIIMNPPRFGYPTYIERQWSVLQVFGITRLPSGAVPGMPRMREDQRVDYSKSQGSYQGSDRNTNASPLGLGGSAG